MDRLRQFATDHPLLFAFLVTLSVLAGYVVTTILALAGTQNRSEKEMVEAIGRLGAGLVFVFLLYGLGWAEAAGSTRAGTCRAWLLAMGVLAYEIVTHLYPLLVNLRFEAPDPTLAVPVAVNALASGFIEEIPFRGLLLYALLRLWGSSKRGIYASAVVSAFFFGASHLVHIAFGRPVPQAAFLAVSTGLSGIYYAALVLYGQSVWPVVVAHGVLNAVVSVLAVAAPEFEITVQHWVPIVVTALPAVALGLFLLRREGPRPIVPNAA